MNPGSDRPIAVVRGLAVAAVVLLVASSLLAPVAPVARAPEGWAAPAAVLLAAAPRVLATSPGWTSDFWPTYLQNAERTGASPSEVTIAPGNASGLAPLWTAETGGVIEDSPIVAGGVVYVSAWDGYEYAFNLTNGSRLWKTFVGQTTFSACNYNAARGTTSSAAVENGTVYVLGGNPYLYALNARNGSVEWKTSELVNNPSSGDYNWASPLLYGGSAYVGLSTACGVPGAQGMLLQVNLSGNHSVLHTFAIVPSGQSGGSIWTTSAADPATGDIWVTTGDPQAATSGYSQSILAVRANNLTLVGSWEMSTGGGDYDFGAGPTLFHDSAGRAMVGALNKNGVFYALNRSNVSRAGGWSPVWSDNVSWYFNVSTHQAACGCSISPAAFDGTTLFVGGGFVRFPNGTEAAGSVRAIDPATGAYRWSVPTAGIVRAGLATADGFVVDAPARNDNLTGWVEVRSAANGSLLFSVATNRTVDGPPSIADGILLFGIGNLSLGGPGYLRAFALPVGVPPPSLASAGTPGSYTFEERPAGGVLPYTFRWSFGDGTTSTLAGGTHSFPGPGAYAVSVTVTDAAGRSGAALENVTVPDPPLSITGFTATPPALVVGNATEIAVTSSGGFGVLSYAYPSLPTGCAGPDAPSFSCTPAAAGTFPIGVRVADAYGAFANASLMLTVLAAPSAPPVIAAFTVSPSPVAVGATTELAVTVAGGAPPFAYAYSGLPAGCASADVARLACVPTESGSFPLDAVVTDAAGATASAGATLTVTASSPPIPTLLVRQFLATPSPVIEAEPVDLVTVVTGGLPPYSFQYTGLPAGCLGANASNFTCEPAAPGIFPVVVSVGDRAGDRAVDRLNLSVEPPPPGPPPAGGGGLAGPWAIGATLAAVAAAAGIAGAVLGGRRRASPTSAPARG